MDLTRSIARIFKATSNEPVGTGILVSETHVLTCAHVINEALGRDKFDRSRPDSQDQVMLDFPIIEIGEVPKLKARIVHWWYEKDEDVAGLELVEPPITPLPPTRLTSVEGFNGQRVKALGFPIGYDDGELVDGEIFGYTGKGRLQIRTLDPRFNFIRRGFSGGPVWTADFAALVGITVASDETQTAYCIPTDVLTKLWPDLQVWSKPVCPYRGLFAFQEEDAPFFFGREEFAKRLLEAVQTQSLVAVLGPSGSGKSSVVLAGLLPEFRRQHFWPVAIFRPGNDPFKALAEALVATWRSDLTLAQRRQEINDLAVYLQKDPKSLSDVVRDILPTSVNISSSTAPQPSRLLLIADQFEELYTLCPDQEIRQYFLDVLLKAIPSTPQPLPPLTLLLTLRADFLGQALLYRPFADALQHTDLKLGPMNQTELLQAIRNPAEKQGIHFEAGLVERILEDVGQEPGNLPLLEFALRQLWEKQANGWLTHTGYEAIDQVQGALAQHADRVYQALTLVEQEQARHIFTQLIQPGEGTEDTRRLARRNQIHASWELVKRLADERLLVTNRTETGEETVEVVHEALIRHWQQLRQWMTEDRAFRVWQEGLRADIRRWHEHGQDSGALLHGAPLAQAEAWLNRQASQLSQDEQDFIEQSNTAHKAQQQRELEAAQRLAEEQRRRIDEVEAANRLAHVRALTAFTLLELGRRTDPSGSLALLLIRRAVLTCLNHHLPLPTETDDALCQTVDSVPPHRMTLPRHRHTDLVSSASYSPDGRFIVTASYDKTARVWEAASGQAVRQLQGHTDLVSSASYSPDGHFIVTASADKTARVWEATSGQQIRQLQGHTAWVNSASYSPDGRFIVTASADKTARVWIAHLEDLLVEAERLIQREPPIFTAEERQRFLGEG